MIDLFLSNGNVFVWNAKDWLKLRKEHRITGQLIGCLYKNTRQEILHGLPFLLLANEVTLLLEKKICRLVTYPCLHQEPSQQLLKIYEDYREKIFLDQKHYLRDGRKKTIESKIERIVDGKRRKLLGLKVTKKSFRKQLDNKTLEEANKIEINVDALMAEEISKIPELELTDALVQTHTAYPWSNDDVLKVEWNYPISSVDKLKYMVFKDLWEQGFYVTTGEKFGGDFLAYPGDPIMFHSQFVIHCKDRDEEIPVLDMIGQCRISTHVRKTLAYACLTEDMNNVTYQSFNWDDPSLL